MAEQGSSARRAAEAPAEPTMAQLLDPVAWERRLEEARARRAAALAARKGARGEPATAPRAGRQEIPDPSGPIGAPGPSARPVQHRTGTTGAAGSDLRAAGPSARPALAGIERAGPATGRAIDQQAGRSLRDLAAEARATQPAAGPSAAASAPRARPLDPVPAARPIPLRGLGLLPPRREEGASPVEAAPVMEPADPEPTGRAPADPVVADVAAVDPGAPGHPREAVEAPSQSVRDAGPAGPVLPGPALPSSGRATRITLPDPDPWDRAIDLDPHDFDPHAEAAAAAPPRRGRMALVFGSGLVLGLVAALGLAVLLLDRLGGEAGGPLDLAAPVMPATGAGDAEGPASVEDAAPSEAAGSTAPDVTVTVAAEPGSPPEALAAPAPPAAEEADIPGAPDQAPLAAAEPESDPPAPPALALLPRATLTPPGTPAGPAEAPSRPGLPSADSPAESAAPPAAAPLRDSGDPAPRAGDPLDPEALRAALAAATEPLVTQPRPLARPAGLALAAEAGPDAAEPGASGPDAPGAAAVAEGEAIADEATAASAAEAPAGGGLPSRIIVHAPSAVGEAEIDSVVAVLDGAGYTPTGRVSIPFAIGTTNVRFYFPEDAAAARAIADALGAAGQEAVARDFTGHRPRPTTGTVEIWLAGQPRSAPASSAPSVASSPPPAAAAPAPPPAPVRQADRPRQPPPQAQARGRPSAADAAMRDLEALAEEIARAIERSLR